MHSALSLSHTHTHTHTHTNHGAGEFSVVPGGFGATACAAVFGCSLEAIPGAPGAFDQCVDQPAPWCSGAPTAASLTNKSSGPLFTAAARVAAPATKCSQPATCNVFGCSRKTWNGRPSEQCCRTCKSSGGTHHGPDCECIAQSSLESSLLQSSLQSTETTPDRPTTSYHATNLNVGIWGSRHTFGSAAASRVGAPAVRSDVTGAFSATKKSACGAQTTPDSKGGWFGGFGGAGVSSSLLFSLSLYCT